MQKLFLPGLVASAVLISASAIASGLGAQAQFQAVPQTNPEAVAEAVRKAAEDAEKTTRSVVTTDDRRLAASLLYYAATGNVKHLEDLARVDRSPAGAFAQDTLQQVFDSLMQADEIQGLGIPDAQRDYVIRLGQLLLAANPGDASTTETYMIRTYGGTCDHAGVLLDLTRVYLGRRQVDDAKRLLADATECSGFVDPETQADLLAVKGLYNNLFATGVVPEHDALRIFELINQIHAASTRSQVEAIVNLLAPEFFYSDYEHRMRPQNQLRGRWRPATPNVEIIDIDHDPRFRQPIVRNCMGGALQLVRVRYGNASLVLQAIQRKEVDLFGGRQYRDCLGQRHKAAFGWSRPFPSADSIGPDPMEYIRFLSSDSAYISRPETGGMFFTKVGGRWLLQGWDRNVWCAADGCT